MAEDQMAKVPSQLYYLDEDFSPRSLRKSQLRSILKSFDIIAPAHCSKADLIRLFQIHVKSQRDAILNEHYAKEGHSRQSEYTQLRRDQQTKHNEDDDHEKPSSSRKTIRRRKRTTDIATSRPLKDKDGFAIPEGVAPKRATIPIHEPTREKAPTSFTAQDSFASSDEDDTLVERIEQLHQRRQRSEHSTIVKLYPSLDDVDQQAESSVQAAEAGASWSALLGGNKDTSPADKPNAVESKAQYKDEADNEDDSSDEYESEYTEDSSDMYSSDEYDDDWDDHVSEDEVAALIWDLQGPPKLQGPPSTDFTPKRWSDRARVATYTTAWLVRLVYCIIASATLIYLTIILIARKANGYCDSNGPTHSVPKKVFFPLSTSCIPCPPYGTCTDGNLVCPPLYKKRQPLYNVFGIFPVMEECVPDTLLGRYVATAENDIRKTLARRQGEAICRYVKKYGKVDRDGEQIVKTNSVQLIQEIEQSNSIPLDSENKRSILATALSNILADPDVHQWEINGTLYIGTSETDMPIGCYLYYQFAKAPQHVRHCISALLGTTPVAFVLIYCYLWRLRSQRKTNERVQHVLSLLREQYTKHIGNPDTHPDPGCPVSHLRAQITDVSKPGAVEEWSKVLECIQAHPHVRRAFREVRGEPCEYWELIG